MKLNIIQRVAARAIVRKKWIESGGDVDKALELYKADHELVGIDPALMLLLVELALALLKYWRDSRVGSPPFLPLTTEPGFSSDEQ